MAVLSADLDQYLDEFPPSKHAQTRRFFQHIGKLLSFCISIFSYLFILFPRSLKPASNKQSHQLHPTAYLDALRGYAAWIAYNSHVTSNDWIKDSKLMQFSAVKLLFRGSVCVDAFFVISGYALSYKMLSNIHANKLDQVWDTFASSLFRRHLRLFLPTIAATFIAMIAFWSGFAIKLDKPEVLQPTFWGNLKFWIFDTIHLCNPFAHITGYWWPGVFGSAYLIQMWTIPIEFRGSIVLFLFVAATCKMPTRNRVGLTWLCIVTFFLWEAHYVSLFLVGMWMADMRFLHAKRQQESLIIAPIPTTPIPLLDVEEAASLSPRSSLSLSPSFFRSKMAMFLEPTFLQQLPYITLFIMSFPILTAPLMIYTNSPFPFNIMAYFIPDGLDAGARLHFPLCIGVTMLIYALDHAPILQKLLETQFSQYMGEMSFGIYAMHQTVRWIVWDSLFLKWDVSYWGPNCTGFWYLFPPYLVMTILVFWAAELFRRIDVQIVSWVRKLETWMFSKD